MALTALEAICSRLRRVIGGRDPVVDGIAGDLRQLRLEVESLHGELERARASIDHLTILSEINRIPPSQFHALEAVWALSRGVSSVYGNLTKGHVAEFGTMSGTTAKGLAGAMKLNEIYLPPETRHLVEGRELHLFDSFVGMPGVRPDEVDYSSKHVQIGSWAPGTCRVLSAEELRTAVTAELAGERVKIFEGWFRDTLPQIPVDTKYALVHVDCDLYSSAVEVLDYLFRKRCIEPGCNLYFDDWDCDSARPEAGERRAWAEVTSRYRVRYSECDNYGLFGKRMIVHAYDYGSGTSEE